MFRQHVADNPLAQTSVFKLYLVADHIQQLKVLGQWAAQSEAGHARGLAKDTQDWVLGAYSQLAGQVHRCEGLEFDWKTAHQIGVQWVSQCQIDSTIVSKRRPIHVSALRQHRQPQGPWHFVAKERTIRPPEAEPRF
jgi:hypothetical protein